MNEPDTTRESWDIATANHNAHKGDQAAFLKSGGDTLFPEELELLGQLSGKSLVHLQCNSGQDSLCLARRGATVTGVDFSGVAIRFARQLSFDSGIKAQFIESELLKWFDETDQQFDLAFSSYGAVGWLPDLTRWARGISKILKQGGRFVYVEFHPIIWSIGPELKLSGDDYFRTEPFRDPVGDYVQNSGEGLNAVTSGPTVENRTPATSWQYPLARIVDELLKAGLVLETLREYPYSNGCKLNPSLVAGQGKQWHWPEGTPRIPLMFGLSVRKS